jgi:hypothetical protein
MRSAVLSPSGKPILCADEAEAARVRAWVAWVVAQRALRARRARQRALEAAALADTTPAPQDYLRYRRPA